MDQTSSKRYVHLDRHLNDGLRESLKQELYNISLEFEQDLGEWYRETYSEIVSVKKDDAERKRRLALILSQKIDDLRVVLDDANKRSFALKWQKMVDKVALKIPEVVEEIQAGERFVAQPSDSFRVKVLKGVKSLAKTISGREEWKQKIKLRNVVRYYLLADHEKAARFMGSVFHRMAMSLEFLLEQETDGETDKRKLKITANIEKHLESAIQYLNSDQDREYSIIDEIVERVCEQSELSGTIEEVHRTDRENILQRQAHNLDEKLAAMQKRWGEYHISQYSDFALQVELARFMRSSDEAREAILEATHLFYRDRYYLPVERALNVLKEIRERLNSQDGAGADKKTLGAIQESIRVDVIEGITEEIYGGGDVTRLTDEIQRYIADLQIGFSGFSETITLAEERTIEERTPKVKLDTIRWQKLAARYITENALREMDPSKANWQELIDSAVTEVQEAFQIIEVNLLTAAESEKERGDNESVDEIASGGAERAIGQLQDIITRVRENQDSYEKNIKENLPDVIDSLVGIMLSRSYSELEMTDKALQVKAAALNWRQVVVSKFYLVVEKGEVLLRYLSPKITKVYKATARFLGFDKQGEVSTAEKRNLAEYLANVISGKEYPYVYRRLFSFDFEIDKRFYSPPEHLYKLFEQALLNWRDELDTNFLVTGERGSGKSLAIRFVSEKFLGDEKRIVTEFDKTIHTEKELVECLADALGCKGVSDRDELISKIQKRRTRAVFIVENIHNTFVRNIHGYEAIESFWVIMTSTRNRLFWIVSSSAFAWSHFEKVFGADQFFSHIVRTDNMDRKVLEQSIMSRHKATGYDLVFEPGPATQKTRAFKKIVTDEVKVQEFLRDQYFTRLDKIAEGNFSIAQIFWMQSIKEFTKKEVIQLPTEVADIDKLEVPSREVLFTLAALTLHECLNEQELAMSLHQDLSDSRLMLSRLKSKGIVELTEHGYQLNHLVYRQVVRLLKKRNIIH
jgi:hypothetical protein